MSTLLVFVGCVLVSCLAQQDFYSFPNYEVAELHGSITLECNYTNVPYFSEPRFWVTPERTALEPNTSMGRRMVSEDAYYLHIDDVQEEDIGYWHCGLITPNATTFMLRIGLNANGPYFEDMWAKYRDNVIIALSAGGGFAVFAVACCLAWQFRWEKKMAEKHAVDVIGVEHAYEMDPKHVSNGGQANSAFSEEKPPAYNGNSEQTERF